MLFLDENPVACAMGTPISLYKHTLLSIKSAYDVLTKVDIFDKDLVVYKTEPLDILVRKDFKFSKKNRDWLVDYFNTLSLNYKNYCGENFGSLEKKYMPRRRMAEYMAAPLKIHKPTYEDTYTELVQEHSKVYSDTEDNVLLSRLMLMHMQPTADEFPFGEPEWIKQLEYRDYVSFDPIQKKFIKISRSSVGYKYFWSYISDNWIEIEDVPKEMDIIIEHLLSNQTTHD